MFVTPLLVIHQAAHFPCFSGLNIPRNCPIKTLIWKNTVTSNKKIRLRDIFAIFTAENPKPCERRFAVLTVTSPFHTNFGCFLRGFNLTGQTLCLIPTKVPTPLTNSEELHL